MKRVQLEGDEAFDQGHGHGAVGAGVGGVEGVVALEPEHPRRDLQDMFLLVPILWLYQDTVAREAEDALADRVRRVRGRAGDDDVAFLEGSSELHVQAVDHDDVPRLIEGGEHGRSSQGCHVGHILVQAVERAAELDEVHDVVARLVQ